MCVNVCVKMCASVCEATSLTLNEAMLRSVILRRCVARCDEDRRREFHVFSTRAAATLWEMAAALHVCVLVIVVWFDFSGVMRAKAGWLFRPAPYLSLTVIMTLVWWFTTESFNMAWV